jgi:hypothetical protein
MRKIILAAVAAALTVTGCTAIASSHTVAHKTPAVQAASVPSATPSPVPAPSCDLSAWAGKAQGVMGRIGSDLTNASVAANEGDVSLMGFLGLKLAHAAVTGEHRRPPACAPRLRSAWRRMLLWFGIAGTAAYAGANNPAYMNHDFAIATRAIRRGSRLIYVVKAQIQAVEG